MPRASNPVLPRAASRLSWLLPLTLLTVGLLGGCASDATKNCEQLAGPTWSKSSAPPANANALLALSGIPQQSGLQWYVKGKTKVMACVYQGPMASPGCPTSRGYVFENNNGNWASDGMLLDSCQN